MDRRAIQGNAALGSASALLLFTGTITLNNSVVATAGTNPLTFSGVVTQNGTNNVISSGDSGATTLSGQIAQWAPRRAA